MGFGKMLRQLREKRRWTQKKLLAELKEEYDRDKYQTSDISKWENGKTQPPDEVIETLEDILGVDRGLLLEAADRPMYIKEARQKFPIDHHQQELKGFIEKFRGSYTTQYNHETKAVTFPIEEDPLFDLLKSHLANAQLWNYYNEYKSHSCEFYQIGEDLKSRLALEFLKLMYSELLRDNDVNLCLSYMITVFHDCMYRELKQHPPLDDHYLQYMVQVKNARYIKEKDLRIKPYRETECQLTLGPDIVLATGEEGEIIACRDIYEELIEYLSSSKGFTDLMLSLNWMLKLGIAVTMELERYASMLTIPGNCGKCSKA